MAELSPELLTSAASEVLETMFFSPAEEGAQPIEGEALSAWLSFKGEPSGAFGLSLTRDAALSLSGAFLGADESELSAGQVGEVVCELANMICGSILSRVETDSTFELHSPVLGEHPAPESAVARTLVLESGQISVWVDLHPPV